MAQLVVTLKTLAEIDKLVAAEIIGDYDADGDNITVFHKDEHTYIDVPIIMLGTKVTFDDYCAKHTGHFATEECKVDKESPEEIAILKAITQTVHKGKIDCSVRQFELTENTVSFNETDRVFRCGCESFNVKRANELIKFIQKCISDTAPKAPPKKKKPATNGRRVVG